MALNRKLTPIIAGRAIKSASQEDNALTITFSDSSTMRIKTGGQASTDALNNRTIKSVRQSGTTMNLDFTDGTSAPITLAEATSSVMLRDAAGKMEYAD